MADETTDIRDEIRRADDAFEEVFGEQDAARLADFYTDDGMLLPAGSDFVRGKDAIRSFWQGAFDMGIAGAELDPVEVVSHGDAAIEVGRYALTGGDGTVLDEGKYVVIWAREDGRWKLHRDIWTTSRPTPAT